MLYHSTKTLPLYQYSTYTLPIIYQYSTNALPLYQESTTLPILYLYSTNNLPILYHSTNSLPVHTHSIALVRSCHLAICGSLFKTGDSEMSISENDEVMLWTDGGGNSGGPTRETREGRGERRDVE